MLSLAWHYEVMLLHLGRVPTVQGTLILAHVSNDIKYDLATVFTVPVHLHYRTAHYSLIPYTLVIRNCTLQFVFTITNKSSIKNAQFFFTNRQKTITHFLLKLIRTWEARRTACLETAASSHRQRDQRTTRGLHCLLPLHHQEWHHRSQCQLGAGGGAEQACSAAASWVFAAGASCCSASWERPGVALASSAVVASCAESSCRCCCNPAPARFRPPPSTWLVSWAFGVGASLALVVAVEALASLVRHPWAWESAVASGPVVVSPCQAASEASASSGLAHWPWLAALPASVVLAASSAASAAAAWASDAAAAAVLASEVVVASAAAASASEVAAVAVAVVF